MHALANETQRRLKRPAANGCPSTHTARCPLHHQYHIHHARTHTPYANAQPHQHTAAHARTAYRHTQSAREGDPPHTTIARCSPTCRHRHQHHHTENTMQHHESKEDILWDDLTLPPHPPVLTCRETVFRNIKERWKMIRRFYTTKQFTLLCAPILHCNDGDVSNEHGEITTISITCLHSSRRNWRVCCCCWCSTKGDVYYTLMSEAISNPLPSSSATLSFFAQLRTPLHTPVTTNSREMAFYF